MKRARKQGWSLVGALQFGFVLLWTAFWISLAMLENHDHCASVTCTGGCTPSCASSPPGTAMHASTRLMSANAPSDTAHTTVSRCA